MKITPKALVDWLLKRKNLTTIDRDLYLKVFGKKQPQRITEFLKAVPQSQLPAVLSLLEKSQAQLLQDIFVLLELDFKKEGYFVEFGATNGFKLSNSYMLEKDFGWSGIVAEPARQWHPDLIANRRCNIETHCVWHTTGETLQFRETDARELSTIAKFSNSDNHARARLKGIEYPVTTISLYDLLKKYNAPKKIDYLSIDTEGSEFDILENFEFDEFEFGVITCEHNWAPARQKLFNLLTSKGYVRKWEDISQFDDWYVRA